MRATRQPLSPPHRLAAGCAGRHLTRRDVRYPAGCVTHSTSRRQGPGIGRAGGARRGGGHREPRRGENGNPGRHHQRRQGAEKNPAGEMLGTRHRLTSASAANKSSMPPKPASARRSAASVRARTRRSLSELTPIPPHQLREWSMTQLTERRRASRSRSGAKGRARGTSQATVLVSTASSRPRPPTDSAATWPRPGSWN